MSDLRNSPSFNLSDDLEDLALNDRLSILKGPQPVRFASESSSQQGLGQSKYAKQNAPAAPAAPKTQLQSHNAVMDTTASKKPGTTPANTRPYQINRIADNRRNIGGCWDATKLGNLHCHESQRPGGHAPWAPFRKIGNQDSVRDAFYLNLCHDEQLKACMDMYGRGIGCRHANKPEDCPNSHEVKPWQLQWLVENRNLHPDVAFYMIHYYNLHRPRRSLALEKLPRNVQPGIAGAGVPLTNPPEAEDFYSKSIEVKGKSERPDSAESQQEKIPSSKVSAATCALEFPWALDPQKLSLRTEHTEVLTQPNIKPMLEEPILKTTSSLP